MSKIPKIPIRWPYSYHDVSTWKYIDYVIIENDNPEINNGKNISAWIENPEFRYKHLDKKEE